VRDIFYRFVLWAVFDCLLFVLQTMCIQVCDCLLFVLQACVSKLLQDWGITQNVKDDYVHEL